MSAEPAPSAPIVVRATLKAQVLDGIEVMDAPVGREYLVDVSSKRTLHWHNHEHGGRQRDLECVRDVIKGGWLPLELLELHP